MQVSSNSIPPSLFPKIGESNHEPRGKSRTKLPLLENNVRSYIWPAACLHCGDDYRSPTKSQRESGETKKDKKSIRNKIRGASKWSGRGPAPFSMRLTPSGCRVPTGYSKHTYVSRHSSPCRHHSCKIWSLGTLLGDRYPNRQHARCLKAGGYRTR